MGFFNKLFEKSQAMPDQQTIQLVEDSFKTIYHESIAMIAKEIDWMLKIRAGEKDDNSKVALFEYILSNSVIVLQHFQFALGKRFPEFRNLYYGKLALFSEANKLTEKLPSSVALFIASRLTFYTKDAESLTDFQVYYYNELLYSKLAHSFFEAPLSLSSDSSSDTGLVLRVSSRAQVMAKKVVTALSSVI